MTQVQAGLAAWAICRVPAGLPAVSWLVDLNRELMGHCPATVNAPAWNNELCVLLGQGLPGWQLDFPGEAEQLVCIQDGWPPVSAITWLGSLDWLGPVQAGAGAATGSALATPIWGSAGRIGMCTHHNLSAAVSVAGLRQCSSGLLPDVGAAWTAAGDSMQDLISLSASVHACRCNWTDHMVIASGRSAQHIQAAAAAVAYQVSTEGSCLCWW